MSGRIHLGTTERDQEMTTSVTSVLLPTPQPTGRRRAVRIGAVAALGAVVAGCAQDAPQDTWAPAGKNARDIDNLQTPVFAIAGFVGLLVFAAIGFAVWKYRDRGQPIPEQTHGKPVLEVILTIIPALILLGIAIPTVSTVMALNDTDDTECVVNVTGQQWWWEMDYPVQDGCGGIAEPIITSGQMVIPTDTNVLIRGTSRDVIHSFWIPRLNGKRDMVPGRVHTLRMQADAPGIYAGQCTEFCGLSHANMRMEVIAMEPDDFETWKAGQLEEYESPTDEQAQAGESAFITNCSRCHQIDGLTDADGEPVIARPDIQVWSGAAPNLTNLMSRTTFAGASWWLLNEECRGDDYFNEWDQEQVDAYLGGVTEACLNEVDIREWLRNSPEKKPMYADAEKLDETDGLTRGMPYLALSEDQIDDLLAYLLERT